MPIYVSYSINLGQKMKNNTGTWTIFEVEREGRGEGDIKVRNLQWVM